MTQDMSKKRHSIITIESVSDKIIEVRGQKVILDFAVAELYGTETKEVNRAVKNNPGKFPDGWMFELKKQELEDLRWKNFTTNLPSPKSRVMPKAFTERGLYMLATILTGEQATRTTIAIVDTFAKLRDLQRTIGAMAQNPDEYQQKSLMQKSGEIVDDLFGDSLSTNETETEIELNFAVLKLKHTIKRKKNQ